MKSENIYKIAFEKHNNMFENLKARKGEKFCKEFYSKHIIRTFFKVDLTT